MATYFHGNPPEMGAADGLQTLILMNPAYAGYTDQSNGQPPPQSGNFVFLNNGGTHGLSHAPPQTQHFVGVPLSSPPAASPHDHPALRQGFLHPRAHDYGLYTLPADLAAARDITRSQQGLSLSLSSAQPPLPGYGLRSPEAAMSASPGRGDAGKTSVGSPAANRVQGVLLSSKYLKATQELLDEVVNVGKTATADPPAKNSASGGESSGKRHDLTTGEKQEIQMKKAKLVNMLDEVDQRYMQYHHQMQLVISWFDQASGVGSAKTYTALALQTISKQFRCLKDAILVQIRTASKSLGEDESNLEGKIEGSRLKYVDNQIRQQRALQQLGMIQHNAWRPQRGLPERSVSVLRSWLFEHFLHPYPKDSDKLMLAKQTGLTRSQVSNWFINARVRLWKPMVEEMYTEEMKENDNNNDNVSENNQTSKIEEASTEQIIHMGSEVECSSPKKMRISDMLQGYERQGGFGSYPMGELGADQFQYSGSSSGNNGVSLTLGLPHRDNNLGSHQGFLGMEQLGETRGFGGNQMNGSNVYESISVTDRKRFAVQLLPDFVA